MNEQIESVISNALLSTSKGMGIDLRNIRLQMRLESTNGDISVGCYALEGTSIIGDVSWNKILGIKYLAFKGLIIGSVEKKLLYISKDLNINKSDINVRFYAIDNRGTPNVYLFEKNKGIKELELKELI